MTSRFRLAHLVVARGRSGVCRRPENVSVGIMAAISFVPRLGYLTDPQQGRKSN